MAETALKTLKVRFKMSETQAPEVTEAETPAEAKKTPKEKTPCLCSRLETLENVRESEPGGDLIWDAEYNTGCPGILTSKTFAPGHDAKTVGFLLEMHAKGLEVSRLDGGVRTYADPAQIAEVLGDALHAKFLKGVENFDKRQADKLIRAEERAAKKAKTEADKLARQAEKKAAKAAEKAQSEVTEES